MNLKKSLSQHVEYILRKKIMLLELKEGEHLKESSLAEELNISRGPIREAIKKLEFEGLVNTTSSGRTLVAKFDLQYVRNLYKVRTLLETYAVQNISKEVIEQVGLKLKKLLNEMQDCIKNNKQYLENDFNIHYEIVQMSQNQTLIQSWLAHKDLFITLIEVTTEATKARNNDIFKEHEEIVAAILNQNLHEASEKLEEHLMNASNYYSNAVFKLINEEA